MPRRIAEHEYCAFDPSGRAIAEKRREDSARPLGAPAARMAQRRVLHKAARDVARVPAAHAVARSLPDHHSTYAACPGGASVLSVGCFLISFSHAPSARVSIYLLRYLRLTCMWYVCFLCVVVRNSPMCDVNERDDRCVNCLM